MSNKDRQVEFVGEPQSSGHYCFICERRWYKSYCEENPDSCDGDDGCCPLDGGFTASRYWFYRNTSLMSSVQADSQIDGAW